MPGIHNGIGTTFRNQAFGSGGGGANNDFVIEVDTTQAGSASDTIILPLQSGGTYSGTIDWGDSSSDDLTYANRQHTYAAGGTYTITISGDTFEGWRVANSGDKLKFIDIQNWGFFTISSSDRQFDYCQNLNVTATDAPTITTTSFSSIFRNCDALTTPDFSGWDTSTVTNMTEAFNGCALFNGNISGWVHSGVTNVRRMLINAVAFNQDLDTWNTSGVTNWYEMMRGCTAFNGDVSNWSVNGSLDSVFLGCTSLSGTGLNTWDTSNATSLVNLFSGCTSLTGGYANWDVSNVTSLQTTFLNCDLITDSFASWDTSAVTSLYGTFVGNSALLIGIENWDTSAVTNMYRTFTNAPNMNRNIGSWNTSLVTNMNEMLRGTAIDQDLSSWDINQVTNLNGFGIGITLSTANYDALLIAWDAQGAMSYTGTVNFGTSQYSCRAASAHSSLITKWGGITDGGLNTSINCDFVSTWDTTQAGSASDTVELPLLSGGVYSGTIDWGDGGATSTLSYANRTHVYASSGTYTITISGTIEGWQFNNGGDRRKITNISNFGNLTITTASAFYGCQDMDVSATDSPIISSTTLQYCFRNCQSITSMDLSGCDVSAVTNMTSMFNKCQSATSFGISGWDTSNVTAMNYPSLNIGMFQSCLLWNEDISGWDVSNITNMRGMFGAARVFNSDLSSWNVSNVTNMNSMFDAARAFNQNIGSWNVSSVTDMSLMFRAAWAFNQNIGSWNTANVTTMSRMFDSARDFNNGGSDSIRNWDVSSNTTMYLMFGKGSFSGNQDTVFNQPIGDWNTSSVTNMNSVFHQNTAFDQDISNWDITNVTSMQAFSFEFGSTTPISTTNYDALLIAWEADLQTAYPGGSGYTATITVDFETSQFTLGGAAATAKNSLLTTFGWTITDGGGV